MEQVMNGDMFIIPNPSHNKENNSFNGEYPEMWQSFLEKRKEEWKRFGIPVSDSTKFIEIWATNPQVDNFADHHRTFAEITGGEKSSHRTRDSFPKFFPLDLIKDLKEGMQINLTRDDGLKVNLTANQSDHRYSRFGKFEDVISKY